MRTTILEYYRVLTELEVLENDAVCAIGKPICISKTSPM